MIERILLTFLPVAFLAVVFGSGERFRRRHIDMDGDVPINRALFYTSKYVIAVVWLAMALHAWGANLSLFEVPGWLEWGALAIWTAGFVFLFLGRFELGTSFRIGRPRERTSLRMDGLYRLSRNPMYLGMYATLLASVLHTMNPVLLLVAGFVIAVHHRIVLTEEDHLRHAFGEDYTTYCRQVRRYL